jgi:predicted RNase H-like nuclease (RuvC/YqgF family)
VRQIKYPQRGRQELGMANLKGARHKGIEFWRAAVERLNQGESVRAVVQALGVDRRGLERWRDRLNSGEAQVARPRTREAALKKEVEKLKQALAEKVLEVDFLQGALHKIEERRQKSGSGGAQASTTRSGK